MAEISETKHVQSSFAGEDEALWEYEYDPEETETFYFSLDVTAHQPREAAPSGPGPRSKKRKRAASPSRAEPSESSTPMVPDPNSKSEEANPSKKEVQILALHTTNPILKFNNTYYSGTWTTELGTQVFIAPAKTISEPLRPGYKVDVVGLSRARLAARPVEIHHRPAPAQIGASQASAITIPDDDGEGKGDTGAGESVPSEEGRNLTLPSNSMARKRSEFLQKLAAVKSRRGETDVVPLTGMRDEQSAVREKGTVGPGG